MQSPQAPDTSATPPPERASVLLVDDTPANLVALRAILEDPAYDLVEAHTGEEALGRLKAQEFAAVLLDVRMPGMSGFEVAKRIRADERSRHTPIIFLTADDIDRAQVEAGYALGAVDFFVKPLSAVVVQAKVRGFVTLFQQKERARREAEQLRLIVQGTTDYAIFMLDPQGRVATWNAGAERIKGYTAADIIGQHFSKFYPQDVIDRGWPEHELKVATAEGRFEDEGWRLRKDGSRFWANVVITALRDERGQLRGFSKVTRDLTERKRAEESLRQSEERFRHMVEGVQDYAIFMLDQHGNVATWNAGAERIKQYKADEIIGRHFSTFYPRDVADSGFPAHELKVAAAEGRFEDEGWRVRKDGTQFWANVVITAVKDDQGGLLGFTKVTRDLTARKQAEEALRRSEERFRLIVESAKDYAIFLLDPQGNVASWNAGAERIKGYTAADIIGKHFSTFYPQEALDRGWPAHELKVAAAEGRFEDEGWRVRKNGSQFWANVVITALKDERGNLLGFSKITRDLTARKQAEENARRLAEETAARRVAHEERERLHVTLSSIGDAVISTDAGGRVEFLNPVAEELVGWKSGEAAGQALEDVFRIVNEDTRQPVENPALRALRDGKIVGLANHTVLISKEGTERPIDDSAAPIRNERGDISGSVLVFRDISERKRGEAALAERMRLLALNAAVGEALVQGDGLGPVLQRCAGAMVKHLGGAFARIWTLNEAEAVLELRASAGMYTHLDGPHSRVPVGQYKIGQIAEERRPHLTNAVVGDPRVGDQEWAKREGMVAFAGYPLVVDDRLVGVMAMFARRPLTEATLGAMASVADEIAIGIERKSAQERLDEQREWLAVTLASIGDAVIATDDRGRVTFLNGVAQGLTGWASDEAQGEPLEAVFVILNEQTRQPVENPVEKVLRDGVIVGLGNHTVLVAKDGTERPIDDSAAPIRDSAGGLIGVVLVFRDVTEQRRAEQELRASEARKSAVVDTALDAIITMDHEGRVVEFNPAAERIFGHRRGDVIGRELGELVVPPSLREQHRQGMTRYLATGDGPVVGKRLELPALRADGTEFPVELAITRISHDGPPLFTAYLRDITERQRVERQRNARLAVTHALTVAATVDDGAANVLGAVCENLGWDVGFLWAVTEDGTTLACRSSRRLPGVPVTKFERDSCSRTFAKGEGLPGRVWATGKPAWILDVATDPNFPRVACAAEEGLHSAFACPVTVGDRLLGVIEFFARRTEPPDPSLLEMMGTVAGAVGQFLERRRAEEGLREQTATAETLLRIGGLLSQELDLHRLVQIVTDEGTRLCGAQFGAFFYNVVGDRGEAYTLYTISGVPREAFDRFPMPRNTALFSPTFKGECVVRLPDVTQDARYGKSAPHHGMPEGHLPVKSYLAVPVISRTGEVLGGLFFGHAEPGVFTARHERLLVGIAGQAAVAIDNARLHQRTQAAAERLNLALSAADLGDWSWDSASDVVTFSERAAAVFGIPPGPHMTWTDMQGLLHPDDRGRARHEVERVIAERVQYDIEYRVNRRDGTQVWVGVLGRAVYSADQVVGMYGVVQDVTRRKRSEQTARFLADASAALAVLVDFDSTLQKVASLAVPHFADWATVDLLEDGGTLRRVAVAHVDPAKVALAHEVHRRFPPDPVAPQGVWNILRTGRAEIIPEITDELLVQSIREEERLRIVRELGLKSYIGVPLKVRGKTLGVLTFIAAESGHRYDGADLATAQDLADRAAVAVENAQLYRELREADRRKDEFLAVLAHELRNPLAPIRNGLQVLRLAGGGGEMVAEARSMMERQLGHMVRLVDDLLDVSRITRNKLELRKERVALATVIHNAVETSRPLIEQSGHTFSVTLTPAPVYLDADPVRLAQVFSNLLTNAAKYTEPGGRITLTAEAHGGEVVVRVRDTGLGIPAEALPRIFEMFSQVDRNMERAQGGLGIGLTLVRRLAEMHGGTVEAKSAGPGRGSEFTVRLPVLKGMSQQAEGSATDQGAASGPRRRILVVDDNQDSATSLGMMLTLMGNEIHTAHDGLAAVAAAEEFRPDMILLDIGLPKLNGYDACRRIRERDWSRGVVMVALTGWGQEEDRRRSREAGFDHHLVKPVEIAALQTLLNKS